MAKLDRKMIKKRLIGILLRLLSIGMLFVFLMGWVFFGVLCVALMPVWILTGWNPAQLLVWWLDTCMDLEEKADEYM